MQVFSPPWCSGMCDSVSTLTHLCSLKGIVSPGFSVVALQVQSFNLRDKTWLVSEKYWLSCLTNSVTLWVSL